MNKISDSEYRQRLAQFSLRLEQKRARNGLKHTILGVADAIKKSLEMTLWENRETLTDPPYPNAGNPECAMIILGNPAIKNQFFRYALSVTMDLTYPRRHHNWDVWICAYFWDDTAIRILDAGSGFMLRSNFSPTSVETARALSRDGIWAEVVAVDITIPKKMDGVKRDGVLYRQGNLFSLKADDIGLFDCIRCLNVITHYEREEQLALLQNLKSLLKPGGVLIENTGPDNSGSYVSGVRPADALMMKHPNRIDEARFFEPESDVRVHHGPQE